jgi:hypothetical protein
MGAPTALYTHRMLILSTKHYVWRRLLVSTALLANPPISLSAPPFFPPTPAPVLPLVSYGSLSPLRLPIQLLTDAEFKQATWDYVQDTAAATTTWGDIGDWDTSGVGDFSFALSTYRDQAGGRRVNNGNPKAATFVGTAISKWDTSSATSLASTFYGASVMNADLTGWKVGNVVTLDGTFFGASKFTGTGLSAWDIASATSLGYTFYHAKEMNADLTGWKVGNVVTLYSTFNTASKFTGTGVEMWDTTSATSLGNTFYGASEMNADLSGWS